MKRFSRAPLMWLGLLALAVAGPAVAQTNFAGDVVATLRAFDEVPAIGSPFASGHFTASINAAGSEIQYDLTYANLVGHVTQSHIHMAQRGVNGGIVIFLCSNLPDPPAGTQACPASPGHISGTIHAANVTGSTGATSQGFAPGQLKKVLHGIRAGVAYVNVHSDLFPGGEIRGQLLFTPD